MAEFEIKRTQEEVKEAVEATLLHIDRINEAETSNRVKYSAIEFRGNRRSDEGDLFNLIENSDVLSPTLRGVIKRSLDRAKLQSRLDFVKWLKAGRFNDVNMDIETLKVHKALTDDLSQRAEAVLEHDDIAKQIKQQKPKKQNLTHKLQKDLEMDSAVGSLVVTKEKNDRE